MEWFRKALVGMKNNSALGPDGVGYRLWKAVKNTKMWGQVLMQVVLGLQGSNILKRWRDMRVVLTPKLVRDFTLTKN